jgi:poly-gamma-glutamate synthesis protein (capsule biosynthesis protein)
MTMAQETTLAICGDIMVHDAQIDAARQPDGYDFSECFEHVAPIFRSADCAFCNLETTLSGNERGYRGYPLFNTPEHLARNLADAGFSVITTANNHSPDYHEPGIISTLDFLDAAGLRHTGTARSAEERNRPLVLDINGIRTGFLAYTYGTNDIPIPPDKPYLLNFLNKEDIEADVRSMRAADADIIICCPHFGAEYVDAPDDGQIAFVRWLWDHGVDIVIGNHSHIVQPAVWDRARNRYAVFSLGNFLSNQRDEWKDCGMIAKISVGKDILTGKTVITGIEYQPTYVHRWEENGNFRYRILPLENDRPHACGYDLPAELLGRRSGLLRRLSGPKIERLLLDGNV